MVLFVSLFILQRQVDTLRATEINLTTNTLQTILLLLLSQLASFQSIYQPRILFS